MLGGNTVLLLCVRGQQLLLAAAAAAPALVLLCVRATAEVMSNSHSGLGVILRYLITVCDHV